MWNKVKQWLSSSPDATAPGASSDSASQARMASLAESRARIYDVRQHADHAGVALQQIVAFEEQFDQFQRMVVTRLNPGEIMATRLLSVQDGVEKSVVARFRTIADLIEMNISRAQDKTQQKIDELLGRNQDSLEQVQQVMSQLLTLNTGEDEFLTDDLEQMLRILKRATLSSG